MWEGYRRHTGPELDTAKFGTGGMAERAAVYCERIVVAHIQGLWQNTWSFAIKWGRIPGFKFVRADYLGFTNCGGRLPGFAKCWGRIPRPIFWQKVGQITWVGRLPSWWGRIPGHRQKWGAEYLGAAKSGAEYLGAAKSGQITWDDFFGAGRTLALDEFSRDSARSALLTQHVSVAQFFGPLPPVGVRREGGENAHDSHAPRTDTMDDLLDEVGVDLDAMLGIEPDEPEPKPPPGVRVDPRRHKVVCKHWLRGLCKKGDDCDFLHQLDRDRMPECWFFSNFGECSNKDCIFLHLRPEDKVRTGLQHKCRLSSPCCPAE